MIADFFQINCSIEQIKKVCPLSLGGISVYELGQAAKSIGLNSIAIRTPFENLLKSPPLPFIAYWLDVHFVVVYKIDINNIFIADPSSGSTIKSHMEFCNLWINSGDNKNQRGVVILFEPINAIAESIL